MAKVLVSLVSEQTIPNVELIKEFENEVQKFIFISTSQMENQLKWILKAAKISNYDTIEVNPFDISDIEKKLNNYEFSDEDNYILNITGGTKLMSLIIHDFFKNLGAKIYYVTGYKKNYLKVFPVIGKRKFELSSTITLDEYLTAYGFFIKKGKLTKSYEETENFFKFYINADFNTIKPVFTKLQNRRNNNNTIINSIDGLKDLINESRFKHEKEDKLTKDEVKYLTGEWFEEYVYYKVKNEFNLEEEEIGSGYNLTKEDVPNEIDVLFIYNNKLYIIECKTSFYTKQILPSGKEKNKNILGDIIYKSDSLRSKFGLFSNTSIFTLSPIKNEKGNIIENLKPHIQRAELSKIKIVSKRDILSNKPIKELLNIK